MKKFTSGILALGLIFSAGVLPVAQHFTPTATVKADVLQEGITFGQEASYRINKDMDTLPLTVEAIIKLPDNNDIGGTVFGNYGAINGNHGTLTKEFFNLEIGAGGVPRLYYSDGTTTVDKKFSSLDVATGDWVSIALTLNFDEKQATFYAGNRSESVSLGNAEAIAPSNDFMIGGDMQYAKRTKNERYFRGNMSALCLYSDVRTVEELTADMTAPDLDDENMLAAYTLSTQGAQSVADLSGNGYDGMLNKTWVTVDEVDPDSYAYSFAVVGDTQIINRDDPDAYALLYDWLYDNAKAKKIKYVMGLGDITDKDTVEEWERAVEAFKKLEKKIPHSEVQGNHDSAAKFNQYMNYEGYTESFMDNFGDLRNTCREVVVGNVQYLIFTFQFGVSKSIVDWANQIIEAHPFHNVIITMHAYMYNDGTRQDANDYYPDAYIGENLWNDFVSQHENITMVLSGHIDNEVLTYRQDKGVNGNVVTQMLIDPQGIDADVSHSGMVAMFYFSEDGKNVQVEWYSTFQEQLYGYANRFELEVNSIIDPDFNPNAGKDEPTNSSSSNNTPSASSSEQSGSPLAGCMGFVGAEGLISIAIVICAIAKSKKEN